MDREPSCGRAQRRRALAAGGVGQDAAQALSGVGSQGLDILHGGGGQAGQQRCLLSQGISMGVLEDPAAGKVSTRPGQALPGSAALLRQPSVLRQPRFRHRAGTQWPARRRRSRPPGRAGSAATSRHSSPSPAPRTAMTPLLAAAAAQRAVRYRARGGWAQVSLAGSAAAAPGMSAAPLVLGPFEPQSWMRQASCPRNGSGTASRSLCQRSRDASA
jgi:hypothetical protein